MKTYVYGMILNDFKTYFSMGRLYSKGPVSLRFWKGLLTVKLPKKSFWLRVTYLTPSEMEKKYMIIYILAALQNGEKSKWIAYFDVLQKWGKVYYLHTWHPPEWKKCIRVIQLMSSEGRNVYRLNIRRVPKWRSIKTKY